MRKSSFSPLILAISWSIAVPVHGSDPGIDGGADLEILMEIIAVSGREEEAAEAVLARVPAGLGRRDRLGNVVVELGRGEPRRLLACGLDEPGLVVSEIRDDGYLRLRPTDGGARGTLWAQGFEGQKVWIETSRGRVAGAVTMPSIHLDQDGTPPDELFGPSAAFVDVGAQSAAEVREQGIDLLDPIGLQQRMTRYGDRAAGGDLAAGPAAQSKAACAVLIAATRGLASGSVDGSLVIAWLRLETWNRKGIESLVDEEGPFEEVLVASRGFGWEQREEDVVPTEMPDVGSGPMSAGDIVLPGAKPDVSPASSHMAPDQAWYTEGPDWGSAKIGYFGIPARYQDTPVETVATADMSQLTESLIAWASEESTPPLSSRASAASRGISPPASQTSSEPHSAPAEHSAPASLLAELIATYGVSTREEAVRQAVRERLPAWAEPVVDARGNLVVRFGSGDEHVAFVAHLDEVGFTVDEILEDGRLRVMIRGGLSPSAWEAHSAIVHTADGPVRGVFEPRQGWLEADVRRPTEALTVSIGRHSKARTEAAGVQVGDAVTMPKGMERLGRHRAVARSFDDRVGSTAQLLALSRIDPQAVGRRYTFAWVVEEELGLFGAVALAAEIEDLDRIHPIDTFVSSDDPYPDKGFALAPLGAGVVLRAMDNGYLADPATVEYVRDVATRHGIPTQIGFTGGGNDGIAFIHLGATNLPLSWPGRYSHSPVEVMDLRDLEALVDLIVALVEDPPM